MTFGSEAMREVIENNQALNIPFSDVRWKVVFDEVTEYAVRVIRFHNQNKEFSEEDIEEIAQDVCVKVYKGVLLNYKVFYSKYLIEKTRNSWLRKTIMSCICDASKIKTEILKNEIQANILDKKNDSNESENLIETKFSDKVVNVETDFIDRDELYQALTEICKLSKNPQHILVFLMGIIVGNGGNATWRVVDLAYKGKTIGECYALLCSTLNKYLGHENPDDLLKPLKEKVEPVKEQIFNLKKHRFSDVSSELKKRFLTKGEKNNGK